MLNEEYTSNLLACPFCGSAASIVWYPLYYKVRCLGAHCSAASGTSATVEGAKTLWNHRKEKEHMTRNKGPREFFTKLLNSFKRFEKWDFEIKRGEYTLRWNAPINDIYYDHVIENVSIYDELNSKNSFYITINGRVEEITTREAKLLREALVERRDIIESEVDDIRDTERSKRQNVILQCKDF